MYGDNLCNDKWLVDIDQKGWEGGMIGGRRVKVPHAPSVGLMFGLNAER